MAIENLSGVDDVRNEIKVKKMGERSDSSSIHASSSGTSLHERSGSTAQATKSSKNSNL